MAPAVGARRHTVLYENSRNTSTHSLARSFMSDPDMDAAKPSLDLSHAPLDVITMVLKRMPLKDRLTCALVCKAWAEAATAATRSIVLRHTVQDISCLQRWLEEHGNQLAVLQLNYCGGALTALPCSQLQDLLHGSPSMSGSRVWTDIAAATKLTSVSLEDVYTAAEQADVVSALTALPDLQQLTWLFVQCSHGHGRWLSDGLLLKQATQLTALHLASVSTEALEHLGSLTKLQHLNIGAADGCPGLQELKALTRLQLLGGFDAIPASISELTALQQFNEPKTTPTALNQLQVLTGLTQLTVAILTGLSPESPPLQLTGLKHLELRAWGSFMPTAFLAGCTQLRVLSLRSFKLGAPGSLTASAMLQRLVLKSCSVEAADGAADPVSWQQVFPGPGRLPHLTSLQLSYVQPCLQQEDMERLVACCNNLQVLHLKPPPDSFASTLTRLCGLTSVCIMRDNGEQCRSVTQLTGLRELRLHGLLEMSATALRRLTALEHLASLEFGRVFIPDTFCPVLKAEMSDRLLDGSLAIVNKAPAGHPSHVPARLLRAAGIMPAVVAETDEDG